jgi:hypothetical protein
VREACASGIGRRTFSLSVEISHVYSVHLRQPLRLGRQGCSLAEAPAVLEDRGRVVSNMIAEIERCILAHAGAAAAKRR